MPPNSQERRQFVKLDPKVTYANITSAVVTIVGGIFVAGMLYSQQQELQKALIEQKQTYRDSIDQQRRVDEKQEQASKERYDSLQASIERLANRVDGVLSRR